MSAWEQTFDAPCGCSVRETPAGSARKQTCYDHSAYQIRWDADGKRWFIAHRVTFAELVASEGEAKPHE